MFLIVVDNVSPRDSFSHSHKFVTGLEIALSFGLCFFFFQVSIGGLLPSGLRKMTEELSIWLLVAEKKISTWKIFYILLEH